MALQMYVSLQGDNRIVRFLMDPATGSLEPNGDVEIGGGPAPLTFNPDNTVMYVGRRDGLLLSSFAIDQKTGDLSHTGVPSRRNRGPHFGQSLSVGQCFGEAGARKSGPSHESRRRGIPLVYREPAERRKEQATKQFFHGRPVFHPPAYR